MPTKRAGSGVDQEGSTARTEVPRDASLRVAFGASTPDGMLRLNVNLAVDLREFADWPPACVTAFMAGVAQCLTAEAHAREARAVRAKRTRLAAGEGEDLTNPVRVSSASTPQPSVGKGLPAPLDQLPTTVAPTPEPYQQWDADLVDSVLVVAPDAAPPPGGTA